MKDIGKEIKAKNGKNNEKKKNKKSDKGTKWKELNRLSNVNRPWISKKIKIAKIKDAELKSYLWSWVRKLNRTKKKNVNDEDERRNKRKEREKKHKRYGKEEKKRKEIYWLKRRFELKGKKW